MSTLAERLDSIRVRATVPGTEIGAELRHSGELTVTFGPSVYDWLDERNLEHFMAILFRLLLAEWVRAHRAALPDEFRAALGPDDQQERDYLAARDTLEATGASADGRVTISAVGLENFTVRLTPGSVRELREQKFVERTREAFRAFLDDQNTKISELKYRFFT